MRRSTRLYVPREMFTRRASRKTPSWRFLNLEPLPMRLVLENRTQGTVIGHRNLSFDRGGRLRLLVQPDGFEAYSVGDLTLIRAPMYVGVGPIQPAARYEETQTLAVGLDKMFPAPGQYRLQVVLAGSDPRGADEVRSNVVAIDIERPTGLDDAALTYIEATGAARYFLTGLSDEKVDLEQFTAQFADTVYGGYANLILAERKIARGEYDEARGRLSHAAANSNSRVAAPAAARLTRLLRQ